MKLNVSTKEHYSIKDIIILLLMRIKNINFEKKNTTIILIYP